MLLRPQFESASKNAWLTAVAERGNLPTNRHLRKLGGASAGAARDSRKDLSFRAFATVSRARRQLFRLLLTNIDDGTITGIHHGSYSFGSNCTETVLTSERDKHHSLPSCHGGDFDTHKLE